MLIGFIKKNRATSIVLVPASLFLYWLYGFLHPASLPINNTAPLYKLIVSWIEPYPYTQLIIAFILIVCESFLLNYIVEQSEIINSKTHLPGLIYASLMCIQPEMLTLHPILISNLFMLFAIQKIIESYRKEIANSEYFDVGIFTSLAILFYLPSSAFVIFIAASLIIIRPFVWREWVISIIGLLTPWAYVLLAYFWNDDLTNLYSELINAFINTYSKSLQTTTFSIADWSQLALLIICTIFSIWKLLRDLNTKTVRTRSILILLIIFFLLGFASILFAPSYSIIYLASLSIPFSVFSSSYLLDAKKIWIAETLMTLFILSIIINQILS